MFAVLEVDRYEKRLLKRLQRFFEKNETEMSYCSISTAVPFIIVRIKETSRGIDWDEVRNAAGVCSTRLLLSEGITIPEGYGVYRFMPTIYRTIPIFNSMKRIIKTLDLNDKELNITILDKFGVLVERIDGLVECARHITVLTDNFPDYEKASKRSMDNFGATIVINDYDYPKISDSFVFADRFDNRLDNCNMIFCPDPNDKNGNIVTGKNLCVDDEVSTNKPDDIAMFDFVAALYEYNSFKRAGDYYYHNLSYKGCDISEKSLKEIIERNIKE